MRFNFINFKTSPKLKLSVKLQPPNFCLSKTLSISYGFLYARKFMKRILVVNQAAHI